MTSFAFDIQLREPMTSSAIEHIQKTLRDLGDDIIRGSERLAKRRGEEVVLLKDVGAATDAAINPSHPRKPKSTWWIETSVFISAGAVSGSMQKLNDLQESGRSTANAQHYVWYLAFGFISLLCFLIGWGLRRGEH